MNIELLQKVKEHILAEPARLYMGDWIQHGEPGQRGTNIDGRKFAACGTAACIGGWAKVLSGYNSLWEGPSFQTLLGLDWRQSDLLFYRTHWPEQFRLAYKDDGSAKSAQIAAARIEHFIATEGRE